MERKRRLHLWHFKWLILVDCMLVVGAVMSFGTIATMFLDMGEDRAIIMLCVIPPMVLVVAVSTRITIRAVKRRMDELLDGIQRVADGELDVELNERRAGEYQTVYAGFNQMVKELKTTKEEMQNFVNEFSHEFKTPITSISGFAEYLAGTGEGIETEERMKYLQVIRDESLRLAELSQNTLLLSKVEACQIIVEKERFDLGEQIKNCAILSLPQMEEKKIELEVEVPELFYYGNEELMEQVWINLLNNAMKFTPEHGAISIRADKLPEEICVEIEDNGVGMDSETVKHIFEKHYQNDTIHSVRGNGIGLSIVVRIITLCNGRVEVDSRVGEGSTFKVYLPV